jgi:hypothetical protein
MEGQAVSGPGPSTMDSRKARSAPIPRPLPSASHSQHEEQIPDLQQNDPNQELDNLANELEELMGRDDIIEVTDDLTESTVITQLLERVQAGRLTPQAESAEEEEWIEVDKVLDGEETSFNGPSPIRPIPLKDATDHPRLHMVLKNITRRIMSRRGSAHSRLEGMGIEVEPGFDARYQTPPDTPQHSPDSGSPVKSSPSKRSSPFKAIVQAKSAFARRPRFHTSPPEDSEETINPVAGLLRGEVHKDIPVIKPDTRQTTEGEQSADEPEILADLPQDEVSDLLFPHDSLIANLHRFMRYSSAAYGVSPSYPPHQY